LFIAGVIVTGEKLIAIAMESMKIQDKAKSLVPTTLAMFYRW
jgi:hypothetical protein